LEQEVERISRVSIDEIRDVSSRFPIKPTTVGRLLPAATA
jgi:hypothetical protein